jgi:hypothetical protein
MRCTVYPKSGIFTASPQHLDTTTSVHRSVPPGEKLLSRHWLAHRRPGTAKQKMLHQALTTQQAAAGLNPFASSLYDFCSGSCSHPCSWQTCLCKAFASPYCPKALECHRVSPLPKQIVAAHCLWQTLAGHWLKRPFFKLQAFSNPCYVFFLMNFLQTLYILFYFLFFKFLFIYLFIHFIVLLFICAYKLGSFLPPAPTPSLTTHSTSSLSPPPPQYPAETILPLFLILL